MWTTSNDHGAGAAALAAPDSTTEEVRDMSDTEDASTGRPAGAIGWAGLANSYYWIDRKNGIGGYWATQILPFADGVSFPGYMDFESAVYAALSGQ